MLCALLRKNLPSLPQAGRLSFIDQKEFKTLTSNTTIYSLIALSGLLFSLAIFTLEASTTIRWQERAIANYNTAILANVKPAHTPENWWTDSPFYVAYTVWKEDPYNWVSLFVSMLTYGFTLLRKREEKREPQ